MPCLFQLLVISTANKDHAATLKWNTIGIYYKINTHLLNLGVFSKPETTELWTSMAWLGFLVVQNYWISNQSVVAFICCPMLVPFRYNSYQNYEKTCINLVQKGTVHCIELPSLSMAISGWHAWFQSMAWNPTPCLVLEGTEHCIGLPSLSEHLRLIMNGCNSRQPCRNWKATSWTSCKLV